MAKVYQFKISLRSTKPRIWRRIQVPGHYNFFDLHYAIISAMGWKNQHLHQYRHKNRHNGRLTHIGRPVGGTWNDTLDENRLTVAGWFSEQNPKIVYEYDFADSWEHDVILEKILDSDGGQYPRCLGGRRACPPENCGGSDGLHVLLEKLGNPFHPGHNIAVRWLEMCGYQKYNPTIFDKQAVIFS
ncbi:plasmid pRiA4b ORF-3-like protein [Ditylenchus destructor]|nr:plasmid pRiA4b ORF-3-like protein [Ditylenchus destructor]